MTTYPVLPFNGMANLMTQVYQGFDLEPLAQSLLAQSQREGASVGAVANAMMDLSILLHTRSQHDLALALQQRALRLQQIYWLPATRPGAVRLLAFVTSGHLNANTPVEFLVQRGDIDLTLVYVATDLPFPSQLPEHDVALMAVGESDSSQLLLRALGEVLQVWPKPVLNSATAVARLARNSVSRLLAGIPGLVAPPVERVARAQLEQLADPQPQFHAWHSLLQAPFLLRPVDTHAGEGLEHLESGAQIPEFLSRHADAQFFIMPFIPYISPDGLYRKYRIALIQGVPYAGHMALSSHWMIHYVNGGMIESAAKREQEEQFMQNFEQDFAVRHHFALRTIAKRLELDYVVLDCGESAQGELVLFEADSSAVLHAMDPVELFPYKQEPMNRAFDAFKAMLLRSARGRSF